MKAAKLTSNFRFALSLAALLGLGCAVESSAATRDPSTDAAQAVAAPPPAAAAPAYTPATPAEAAAADSLELADAQTRVEFPVAEVEMRKSFHDYQIASERLKAAQLPPGETRPTQQEVNRLQDAALAGRRRLDGLLRELGDRYEKFFSEFPANWYERYRLGEFQADHDLTYPAAVQDRKVIEMAPAFPYAYNSLGALYNHMGRDLEAVLLFRKAIELKGDDPVFYENLAVNYSTHRREVAGEFGWDLPRVFRECILSYQKALALEPKDKDLAYELAGEYVLAKFFHAENTADEAIAAWKYYLTLDLDPLQYVAAYRNLAAICLNEKNDPAAAEAWLEKALQIAPDDASCKSLLERCKAAEKQPEGKK